MTRTGIAVLEFDPRLDPSSKKRVRDGLSGVLQVGSTLWVANDETVTLERLTYRGQDADGVHRYADHVQFALHHYLRLPLPPSADAAEIDEVDVEGLDYRDGYLWLTGSHSLKRKKPEEDDSAEKNLKRLDKISRDGNRFLLARIPLVEESGIPTLQRTAVRNGKQLVAAQLRGNEKGNDLVEALGQDKQLQPFLAIPGKENGIDIEGLAVAGNRIFLGLRGPVLRGWAAVLEVQPEENADEPATLTLGGGTPGEPPYRKHFLQLGGLGIRDLYVRGNDLLILAGPTMDLDGPVTVFSWPDGARAKEENSVVFERELVRLLDVPYGQGSDQGTDHAEGMTLFAPEGSRRDSLLVVYDSASHGRKAGDNGVAADLFSIPD